MCVCNGRYPNLTSVPVVKNVQDAFNFVHHQCQAFGGDNFVDAVCHNLHSGLGISTAFSGVGAPETAGMMLVNYIRAHYGREVPFHADSALEWNAESRAELMCARHKPRHMYVDACEFLVCDIRKRVMLAADSGQLSVQQLAEAVLQPGAVKPVAECVVCGSPQCVVPKSACHIAGTPCVDFSPMPGASGKGALGSSGLPYFCWLALRLLLQEGCIIHENVENFDIQLLTRYLDRLYIVTTAILHLPSLGFPIRRTRRLTICVHRSKVVVRLPWSVTVAHQCQRRCAIDFVAFMIADASEIEEERKWAAGRKQQKKGCRKVVDVPALMEAADVRDSRMVQALNETEMKHLRTYRKKWPQCAYMLGQNPLAVAAHSTKSVLMCQIKNQHITFVDGMDRWITGRELLSLQGFPTHPLLQQNGDITSFCVHRHGRSRCRLAEQSGPNKKSNTTNYILYTFKTKAYRQQHARSDDLHRAALVFWLHGLLFCRCRDAAAEGSAEDALQCRGQRH